LIKRFGVGVREGVEEDDEAAQEVTALRVPASNPIRDRGLGQLTGNSDRRGPLSKHGPTYLRWALLEATMHALSNLDRSHAQTHRGGLRIL
jgi:hypothetical protein